MSGSSYGGGIQWVTAARDARVDVITPNISWSSLISSLYKDGSLKFGWGSALCGLGHRSVAPRRAAEPRRAAAVAARPAPAEHVRQRHRVGPDCAGGPGLVRRARPGPPAVAGQDPDADHAGHGRHAVHAERGDPQLRVAAQPRGAGEDALVLRRARRLPDRQRQGRPRRARGADLVRALPEAQHLGADRSALRVAGRRRPLALRARLSAHPARVAEGDHAAEDAADRARPAPPAG